MANRYTSPFEQQFDATTGDFLSGGLLYFYITGTSTLTNTYSEQTLDPLLANANPVVLNSAGRHGPIFLDPAVTYKAVLKNSGGSTIATSDPVVDPAANVTAAFQVYAGNPNGFVAGSAGTVGGAGASVVWDITNGLLYVCTTSGVAAAAAWTQVGASLSGQVTLTGVITPTTLAANTDNWAPTGLSTASVIRMAADAAWNLTGIVAQPTGTLLTLTNIGSFPITLMSNVTSTAANRFQLPADTVVDPGNAITLRYDGTSSRWRPTVWLDVRPLASPGGRLTLTTAVPVLVSDVTSATTIYYTPYAGLYFPLYNGVLTTIVSIGAELSIALDNNSGHTGYHQSGKNFDLFLTDDSGTIRLVTGPAWSSDTARATALEYKNGFLCNAASMTARFGSASGNTITVAQDRGTYVGTFRASADGTTKWVANPAAAAGGGDCQILLWNMYNRVAVAATSKDSTDTWDYTTLTWRAANGNNANRVSFVRGVNEEIAEASYFATAVSTAGAAAFAYAGIGIDSTSALSGLTQPSFAGTGANTPLPTTGIYKGLPGLGFHYAQALEASVASGTTSWYGDRGAPTFYQNGLTLTTRM